MVKSGKWYEIRFLAAVCMALLAGIPALRAQETQEKVSVDDVDRTFMVRLPKGYDSQQHYPVLILLHGMNQDPSDMERLTRFNELADKDGVIAVYPFALHGRWNVGVRAQEHRSMGMGPGGRGRRGGGGYPGGGGGYPRGGGRYPGGGGQQPQGGPPSDEKRPEPADDMHSSTRCWTSWEPSFRWTRRGFMRRGCRKAAL